MFRLAHRPSDQCSGFDTMGKARKKIIREKIILQQFVILSGAGL